MLLLDFEYLYGYVILFSFLFFGLSKSVVWQVMSVKALGIALKLTLSGMNQLVYPQTWVFTFVVITCVLTQMNYLNKVITSSLLFFFPDNLLLYVV